MKKVFVERDSGTPGLALLRLPRPIESPRQPTGVRMQRSQTMAFVALLTSAAKIGRRGFFARESGDGALSVNEQGLFPGADRNCQALTSRPR